MRRIITHSLWTFGGVVLPTCVLPAFAFLKLGAIFTDGFDIGFCPTARATLDPGVFDDTDDGVQDAAVGLSFDLKQI